MKNCPNCGAPIDPYRVKCDFCGTMYFDWAAWLEDGKPCWITYNFDTGVDKGTITALARPHLETIEINNDTTDITDSSGAVVKRFYSERTIDLDVKFRCIRNPEDRSLYKIRPTEQINGEMVVVG